MEDVFRLVVEADFSLEEMPNTDELAKGGSAKSKKRMLIKGLVSTPTEDADGETLLPSGFDLSYLKSHGFINWNHQAKKDPDMIIGEPLAKGTTVEGDKFMIEAELYDTELGRKVFKLGTLLKKGKGKRKLAFSLEGYATKRNKANKKIVEKAMITHVAVTPAPKNTDSYLELMSKGYSGSESSPDEVLATVDVCDGSQLCLMGNFEIKELSKSHDGEDAATAHGSSDGTGGDAPSVSEALKTIAAAHSQGKLEAGEIKAVQGLFGSLK